ncbi:hypothetical protein [Paraburkholderia tropica]|uniref:hypothetical protein n=1 Tax=Paraburkholderia tropica TaxID=92647 RepID=UPI001CC56C50|nr:hypothetical protein [Paraburkholderia tropica]
MTRGNLRFGREQQLAHAPALPPFAQQFADAAAQVAGSRHGELRREPGRGRVHGADSSEITTSRDYLRRNERAACVRFFFCRGGDAGIMGIPRVSTRPVCAQATYRCAFDRLECNFTFVLAAWREKAMRETVVAYLLGPAVMVLICAAMWAASRHHRGGFEARVTRWLDAHRGHGIRHKH